MSVEDVDVARQFLAALAKSAETGDRAVLWSLLAPDVEWVTPMRDLVGIEEIRDQLTWIRPSDTFLVEFGEAELTDLGDGRIVSRVHQVYRMRGTGDFAYARDRQIELTIRDRKIARYEMEIVG